VPGRLRLAVRTRRGPDPEAVGHQEDHDRARRGKEEVSRATAARTERAAQGRKPYGPSGTCDDLDCHAEKATTERPRHRGEGRAEANRYVSEEHVCTHVDRPFRLRSPSTAQEWRPHLGKTRHVIDRLDFAKPPLFSLVLLLVFFVASGRRQVEQDPFARIAIAESSLGVPRALTRVILLPHDAAARTNDGAPWFEEVVGNAKGALIRAKLMRPGSNDVSHTNDLSHDTHSLLERRGGAVRDALARSEPTAA
jgi:hypothetical protein